MALALHGSFKEGAGDAESPLLEMLLSPEMTMRVKATLVLKARQIPQRMRGQKAVLQNLQQEVHLLFCLAWRSWAATKISEAHQQCQLVQITPATIWSDLVWPLVNRVSIATLLAARS